MCKIQACCTAFCSFGSRTWRSSPWLANLSANLLANLLAHLLAHSLANLSSARWSGQSSALASEKAL